MEKLSNEIESINEQVIKSKTLQQIPNILTQLDGYSIKIKNVISSSTSSSALLRKSHREALNEVYKFITNMRDTYSDNINSPTIPSSASSDHLSQSQEKEEQRGKAIGETIVHAGEISFEDIAGLEVVKSLLHEAVILPVQYPHLFTGKVKPWKSVLLYGPPGIIIIIIIVVSSKKEIQRTT